MTILENAPTALVFSIFILLAIGVAVCTWGRKTPGKGSWLVWAGILILLAGIGLDSGILLQEEFKTKIWMSGWIGARGDVGAITVGVFQDAFALSISVLTAIIASTFLVSSASLLKESNPERAYAGAAISIAGVALAWNSLTPWLAFAGLTLSVLGGVIATGSRWDSNVEANITARFVWERSAGFLIAFFGACILATSRSALLLNKPDILAVQDGNLHSTWIGSGLLVAGLFIQMQPFPFVSWAVARSEVSHPVRVLLNQIFPAWAAFPLLIRLAPQFQSLGLFPGFGWVALLSAVLIIFSGLFQKHWRLGLSAWLAAGFSLSCAFLAFSGAPAALGMLLGVSLSALCLSSSGVALEGECTQSVTHKKRALWVKIAAFLAAAAGTGFIGFVSGTGALRWIYQALNNPGIVASFLFVYFLFVILGWKQLWSVVRLQKASDASWLAVLSLYVLIILSLGVIWTGTITGEILMGSPDRVFNSFFNEFFGAKVWEFANAEDYISASGLYWGTLLFGLFTAYWMSGRKEDLWATLAGVMPRSSRFLAQGYGVDGLIAHFGKGLIASGKFAEKLVDQKIWTEWIPRGLFVAIKTVSDSVTRIDSRLTGIWDVGLKKTVEVPAKALQLVQTGDLRWYLLFALGTGFALLSHFLKT
jgi:hypothetical protein